MSQNQYVPTGSYLQTSKSISITVNVSCKQNNGHWESASLSFTAEKAQDMGDITNVDGVLVGQPGKGSTPNPNNALGPYVPAGSYQLTSKNISITINASCEQTGGEWVPSRLTYTAEEAQGSTGIWNNEGVLKLAK